VYADGQITLTMTDVIIDTVQVYDAGGIVYSTRTAAGAADSIVLNNVQVTGVTVSQVDATQLGQGGAFWINNPYLDLTLTD